MTRFHRVAPLSLLAAVLLGACHFLDAPQQQLAANDPSDPDTETFAPALGVNVHTMNRTTDGVYYADTKVGTGNQLDSAVNVVIEYSLYLKDGTFITTNPQPPNILNMGTFVPGLIEGMLGGFGGATSITGMREGGQRTIVVPSALAYLNVGFQKIPPNATVVYLVTLDQIP